MKELEVIPNLILRPIDNAEVIDVNHPLLKAIEPRADIRSFELHSLSEDTVDLLRTSVQAVFPEPEVKKINWDTIKRSTLEGFQPPNISNKRIPPYIACQITPKEKPTNPTGFFFFPGIFGTSSGIIHTAAAFYGKAQNSDIKPGICASISSSLSLDTSKKKFPFNHVERAAYQTGLILELLKENPCDEIALVAHSLSAIEVVRIAAIMNHLQENGKIHAKIAAILLNQPAGQYNQDLISLGSRSNFSDRLTEEMTGVFPSPADIAEIKYRIDLARENGDWGEYLRLQKQLRHLESKTSSHSDTLSYLINRKQDLGIENRLKEVRLIDRKIADAMSYGQDRQLPGLIKRRQILLYPVMQWLRHGADIRPREVPKRAYVGIIPTALSICNLMPKKVRESVKCPVGIILGENDVVFPAGEAQRRMPINPYPNAPVFSLATVNLPHQGIPLFPEKFAEIELDMITRMREAQPHARLVLKY